MKCRRISTSVVGVLACAFVIAATVRADDAPATDRSTGKISGVVMKDGKPLANARVVLFQGRQKLGKKARQGNNAPPATQPSDSASANQQDRPRRQPLAQATADADG